MGERVAERTGMKHEAVLVAAFVAYVLALVVAALLG